MRAAVELTLFDPPGVFGMGQVVEVVGARQSSLGRAEIVQPMGPETARLYRVRFEDGCYATVPPAHLRAV